MAVAVAEGKHRMRVLWVDADESPWLEADGWKVLEDSGVEVHRVSTCADAIPLIPQKKFDVILVRAELRDAPSLLVSARKNLGDRKIILTSSEWTKEQYRIHAKTEGAAHRYARVPMPSQGFIKMLADLMGCAPSELGTFGNAKKPRRAAKSEGEGEDAEVLRKYLHIKEEQLEISEGEREELRLENERLQKEAHQLQSRLREFEHLQEELSKKISAMESEKNEALRQAELEKEEASRIQRSQAEKLKTVEAQLDEAGEKYENLRVRVRKDIRKIRENERDLEARLELMRKDSSTLLQARDEKVLELQRKIDALEFDLDQVQDSRVQAQMEAERYLAKLSRVARALHISVGMIEDDSASEEDLEELEPVSGGAANAEEEAGAGADAPAGAAPPPADETADNEALEALANDGEPTQMVSAEGLENMGGEPESSSG